MTLAIALGAFVVIVAGCTVGFWVLRRAMAARVEIFRVQVQQSGRTLRPEETRIIGVIEKVLRITPARTSKSDTEATPFSES